MTRLKQAFIILMSTLFLGGISVGEVLALKSLRAARESVDEARNVAQGISKAGHREKAKDETTKPNKVMKPSKGTIYNPGTPLDPQSRHSKDPKAIKGDPPPSLPGSDARVYTPKSLKNLGK